MFQRFHLAPLALFVLLSGCGGPAGGGNDGAAGSGEGPFGPPVPSKLLAPFQGAWKFDLEKTLEAQQAAGATDDELAQLRKGYEVQDKLIPNRSLVFRDNEALGLPFPHSEYRFFHLHSHDGQVCGKAWHHEDRFDPGDMSKCRVQLALVDGYLHFRCDMQEGLPNLNDPDIRSPLPVERDSTEPCDGDKSSRAWSQLMVFAPSK